MLTKSSWFWLNQADCLNIFWMYLVFFEYFVHLQSHIQKWDVV
jgi:hypothetical protein